MVWDVSPSDLYNYLKEDLQLGEKCPIIFIWGQPGIGKTMIVQQIAQELGYHLVVLEVSTIHPYALSGIPVPNIRRRMVELLPLRFVEEVRQHEKEDCIIFLDDFGAADPYQQRIALALTTYRAIGDAALPPSARLVIATNREEDAAYVITPSYAILNRVKHYNLVPKFEDWVSWMHRHYAKTKPTLLELVVSFLTSHPSHFCWTPETAIRKRTAAYPTPRSWANFIANTPEEAIQNPKEIGQRCSFWVGKETATEFYKFCLVPQDEVKAILRNPKLIRQKSRVWQILFINHIIETMYKSEKAIDKKDLEDLLKNVSNDVLAAVLPNLQGDPELEKLRAQLSLQIVSGKKTD
jgi:hypothetical protein